MSRFSDYDEFLKRQQAASHAAQEKQIQHLFASREKLDGIIKALFQTTKEYHETIVLSRKNSILILKKQEPFETNNSFLYRANLIPTDFLPPAFRATDIIERVDYLNPKEITTNDWHANVALQLNLHLTLINQHDVRLTMEILVWGNPDQNKAVLPYTISLRNGSEKRIPYTSITQTFTDNNSERFVSEFENLLMVVTPQVINHREIVWKK